MRNLLIILILSPAFFLLGMMLHKTHASQPPKAEQTIAATQLVFYVRPAHPQRAEFLEVLAWARDKGFDTVVVSAPGPTILVVSDGDTFFGVKTAQELKKILKEYL